MGDLGSNRDLQTVSLRVGCLISKGMFLDDDSVFYISDVLR